MKKYIGKLHCKDQESILRFIEKMELGPSSKERISEISELIKMLKDARLGIKRAGIKEIGELFEAWLEGQKNAPLS